MHEIHRNLAVGLLACGTVEQSLELLLDGLLGLSCVHDGAIIGDATDGGIPYVLSNHGLVLRDETPWRLGLSALPQMGAREMIWIAKTELPGFMSEMDDHGHWSHLTMIPLRAGERIFARMVLFLRDHPRSNPDLMFLLEGMAAQATGAILRIGSSCSHVPPDQRCAPSDEAVQSLESAPGFPSETHQLESALNASEAGTWSWEVGDGGGVVWDNRNRRLFGMEDDSKVTIEDFTNRIHPDDRDRIAEKIRELAAPGAADEWNNEFRVLHPKVGERWLGGLGRVERDSDGRGIRMSGIHIDITERKLVELSMREWNQALEKRVAERTMELHQSEARFRLLAEATFEGISVCEGGILLDCNPQLARMLGYDLDEMIGMPVMNLIAPESRELVERHIQCGQEVNYEFIGQRKDGSTFPVEVHACRRMWRGKETRVSAIRDLTDTKRAAARLQSQQTELYQAQRLALVSEVSAGIVHQIGQPLAAIGINLAAYFATVLHTKAPNCGCVDIMKEIESDVARMRATILHLRALADPEQPNRVPGNINGVVSRVADLLEQEARGCGVEIELALDPSLPECLMDSIQMSQVVLNLLKNSLQALESVESFRKKIVVSTGLHRDEWLEILVCDKGIGISEEMFPHLFSPFFSTKQEGVGIGLRLSRTIVNAHGGVIEAYVNPDGEGVTFRIHLPCSGRSPDTKV